MIEKNLENILDLNKLLYWNVIKRYVHEWHDGWI